MHSGDLGYLKDGALYTVERIKVCIKMGSEKVFPFEVEEYIQDHPSVDDMCVIGVPDEEYGEIVRAVVILKEEKQLKEQEIKDWCKGKIASYKKPRSVVFAKDFPKSPVGKILRANVVEQFGKP